MKFAELKNIWIQLASKYTEDTELINKLWSELEQHYTASGRYYHNLDHLRYMINLALEQQEHIKDPDVLFFSIFYHDIIYTPGSDQNERKSAELAKLRLRELKVPDEKITRVYEQILATKSHQSVSDSDTRYLLDIDLAILGADPKAFDEYTQKIKLEFSAIPPPLFELGRKAFVAQFLKREQIYQTAYFFSEREQRARANLKRLAL